MGEGIGPGNGNGNRAHGPEGYRVGAPIERPAQGQEAGIEWEAEDWDEGSRSEAPCSQDQEGVHPNHVTGEAEVGLTEAIGVRVHPDRIPE
jgi:hypothetical protein